MQIINFQQDEKKKEKQGKAIMPSCGKTFIKISKVIWPHPDHVKTSALHTDMHPIDNRIASLFIGNGSDC